MQLGITSLAVTRRCALVKVMASLTYYVRTFGKREGRKRYNAYHREYKRKNRVKLNAARRKARRLRAK